MIPQKKAGKRLLSYFHIRLNPFAWRGLFFVALSFIASELFAFDPQIRWKILESKNFEVIFAKGQRTLATEYLKQAERAHVALSSVFSEMPRYKIPIVLHDNTDFANGYAAFLPYPHIRIFPSLPGVRETTSHYGNWPYLLLLHEYTHILNMLPANGFYTPLSYIFGTIVRPNALLPKWYIEGLGIEMESRFTPYGRLRSPLLNSILQGIAQEQGLEKFSIDKIGESSLPHWPYGQTPYLFGSYFVHDMVQRNGIEIVDKLNQRFSRRLPFLIGQPFQELSGEDLISAWERVKNSLSPSEKVASTNSSSGKKVIAESFGAAISPSGKQNLVLRSGRDGNVEIWLGNISGDIGENDPRLVTKALGVQRVSWLPNDAGFVFDKVHRVRRHYFWRDLFIYDLATQREIPLTKGMRAQDPSVSQNGSRISYIRNSPSGQLLVEIDRVNRSQKILYRAPLGSRISSPEYIGNDQIVFCGRSLGGKEKLLLYQRTTSRVSVILPEILNPSMPRRAGAGLIVTSASSTSSHVYLSENLREAKKIHSQAAFFIEAVRGQDPSELYVTEMAGSGWRVKKNSAYNSEPLKFGEDTLGEAYAKYPVQEVAVPQLHFEERDYNSMRYLLPRYWIPFVYPLEKGILFQGSTTTEDPVGRHAYGLNGSYDSFSKKFSYGLQYSNRTLPVDLSLLHAKSVQLITTNTDPLVSTTSKLQMDSFIYGLSNAWRTSLAYSTTETEFLSAARVVRLKREGPSAGFIYDSSLADGVSGASEIDFSLQVLDTQYLKAKNQIGYNRAFSSLNGSVGNLFDKRHRLGLSIKASYAPELKSNQILLGDRTVNGVYLVSLANSDFVLRGYPSGVLVGRNLLAGSLEYEFPLFEFYRGWSLMPFFLRELKMALFADGAGTNGFILNAKTNAFYASEMDKGLWSTGIEFRLGSTVFHHLPVSLLLGFYYGFDQDSGGVVSPFLGIGYVGHKGVD